MLAQWTLLSVFDHFHGSRDLLLILDASIPKEEYVVQNAFTIYLTTPAEKEAAKKFTTTAFGPMSFVAFHN